MWGYPLLKTNAQQSHDVEAWGGSARLWIEAGTAGQEFFKLETNSDSRVGDVRFRSIDFQLRPAGVT